MRMLYLMEKNNKILIRSVLVFIFEVYGTELLL